MKKLIYPSVTVCLMVLTWLVASHQQQPTPSSATVVSTASERYPNQSELSATFEVENIYADYRDGAHAIVVRFSRPLDPTLNYDPWVRITRQGHARIDSKWVLHENKRELYAPYLAPQTEYQLEINANIKDADGNTLDKAVFKTISTDSMPSSVGFMSAGSVLPKKLSDGLPVRSVNVGEVDVDFLRVQNHRLVEFLNRFGRGNSSQIYELREYANYTETKFSGRFDLGLKRNEAVVTHLPVQDIPALKQPGMYVAMMRRPGKVDYNVQSVLFFVSDIGLHVRKYKDQWRVYTRSLATGEAFGKVSLAVLGAQGKVLWQGQSNDSGVAIVPAQLKALNTGVLIASVGDEFSLLALSDPELDLSQFAIGGPEQHPYEAYLYTERDLFRPGERVNASLLLRDDDGRKVPAMPIYLRVKRADGKLYLQRTLSSDELGYAETQFALAEDAPTGRWTLSASLSPNGQKPIATYDINVEAFLPERMKLSMQAKQVALKPGQTWMVDVLGQYLYGAVAAENRFEAKVYERAESHPLEAYKDYFFGVVTSTEVDQKPLIDGKLDENGQIQLAYAPETKNANEARAIRIVGKLYETGGRSVDRSTSALLWPSDYMLGLRPVFDRYAPTQKPFQFEVLAAKPDGSLADGIAAQVRLLRVSPEYHWRFNDNQGWYYDVTRTEEAVFEQQVTLSGKGKQTVNIPAQTWGQYRLEIKEKDGAVATHHAFYVGWPWQNSGPSNRPDQVQLKWDQSHYKAGDTAILTVLPPHDGSAVVTIESDVLLWTTPVKVAATGTRVEIPVSGDWNTHDIYANVTVFRAASQEQRATPNRAVGIIHLPLARDERRLEVRIEAPALSEPLRKVQATLHIPQAAGRKARVTLAAVDVGILNITRFETPDPYEYFFRPRRYGVGSLDLYSRVIEAQDGGKARLRFGGDAAPELAKGGKAAKAHVQLVSLFSGAVAVDETGVAQVPLQLPDFNGTLRLMAVAFTDEQFGSAEQELTVRAPVVAEIAMPRFLAFGDRSLLTLDVQNFTGKKQQFQVAVEAASPLTIQQPLRTITLEHLAKTTVKFPLIAQSRVGTSRISYTVSSDQGSLTRTAELSVRPVHPGLIKSVKKALESKAVFETSSAWFDGVIPDTASALMTVSNVPPLEVGDYVKHLLAYPYGCLEQTTSRAYPHLLISPDIATRYGIKFPPREEQSVKLNQAISRLLGQQLSNGGFVLWPGSRHEEPWLSVYVTDFLIQAQQAGYAVPAEALEKAQKRLLEYVRQGRFPLISDWIDARQESMFVTQSYAAYVLAEQGKVTLSEVRSLWSRKQTKPSTGLPFAHLGLALKRLGDNKASQQAFNQAVSTTYERKYLGDYGSDVRDDALIIALMGEHQVKGAESLVFRLNDRLKSRRYYSTQERMALLRAALSLPRGEGRATLHLVEHGKTQTHQVTLPYRVRFDGDDAIAARSWAFDADTTLYLSYQYGGYQANKPEVTHKPFYIKRTLFDQKGQPIGDRPLTVGETIIVQLVVDSDDNREDAMVVDLLPSGLEIINTRIGDGVGFDDLTIGGTNLVQAMEHRGVKYVGYLDDRFVAAVRLERYRNTHVFYLAQAVSSGRYAVPAPLVEDMYQPERRGIGEGADTLVIVDP